jgi:DNA-binding Lrp family transcriptional regulator
LRYIVKAYKGGLIAIPGEERRKKGVNRERIIRVLLNNPEGLSIYRVWKESHSSFSWVYAYLKKLENEGYLDGTKVVKYRELVQHWRNIHVKPRKIDFLVQEPLHLLRRSGLKYALTTYAAENLTQRHLFLSRYDVYIGEDDVEEWKRRLLSAGLYGKGNFRLLVGDDHVFYRAKEVDALIVVSTPQLILDLLEEGGVCEEAANMILEKVEGIHV